MSYPVSGHESVKYPELEHKSLAAGVVMWTKVDCVFYNQRFKN